MMDAIRNKQASAEITMTKIVAVAPNIAQRVIDCTIKLFGESRC